VDGRRRNSGGRRIARGWNQADADQFQTMNALFAEYFPSSPPTRHDDREFAGRIAHFN
jgi:hypothetical protein